MVRQPSLRMIPQKMLKMLMHFKMISKFVIETDSMAKHDHMLTASDKKTVMKLKYTQF